MTTTDNWPSVVYDFSEVPREDIDEAIRETIAKRETEARRREEFCAVYRRLEAHPVSVGRIASKPKPWWRRWLP